MGISAKEQPLGKVFTPDYRFVVPSFQRAYTWQAQNILQLVADLQDAAQTPETPYFLGSLILVRDKDSQYQVIDGQQRLVSLSIIIAVLRELETDPELNRELDDLILEHGNKLHGIMAEPRLRIRERDADFFRDYVQEGNLEGLFDLREGDIASSAQHNIAINARQTYDALADMEPEERRNLASYLVKNVMLVIVVTNDLAGAHRIFDVMNMRGVPLTESDVFKAKSVAALSSVARDAYAVRWDDIMEPLGDDPAQTKEFFRSLYTIITYKAGCNNLLGDFQDDVLKPYVKKQDTIAFIDEVLAPYANAWRMIERPSDTRLPDSIVGQLVALNDYTSSDWKPVAMWALRHSIRNLGVLDASALISGGSHVRGRRGNASDAGLELHDVERLSRILRVLERVSGIDALNRKNVLDRRKRVASAIRDLDKGLSLQRIRGFMITDDDRISALAHLRGELQFNADFKRLLLIRANEQQEGGYITRPRSLNALRILPERVRDGSSFSVWPESTRDYWTDRLGNLVLSQANDKQMKRLNTYADRRNRILLSNSSKRFPLTAQLADINEFTPETLQWRQDAMVKLIADYWDIRYDAERVDLAQMPEEQLSEKSVRRKPSSRRVTIRQVLDAGLLIPGETLVWKRPRKNQIWTVTVTSEGKMRLEDGSEYSTPTAAARAIGGGSYGLDVWKRTSNGQKLSDVWKAYRLKHQ